MTRQKIRHAVPQMRQRLRARLRHRAELLRRVRQLVPAGNYDTALRDLPRESNDTGHLCRDRDNADIPVRSRLEPFEERHVRRPDPFGVVRPHRPRFTRDERPFEMITEDPLRALGIVRPRGLNHLQIQRHRRLPRLNRFHRWDYSLIAAPRQDQTG